MTIADGDFFRPFLLNLIRLHRQELPSFRFQIVLPPQMFRVTVPQRAQQPHHLPLQQRVMMVNEHFPFFKHRAKGEQVRTYAHLFSSLLVTLLARAPF